MHTTIESLRKDYKMAQLDEMHTAENPFIQFEHWMEEAIKANIAEPHAMTLATVNTIGQPSMRIVLLRKMENEAFSFFTNYMSRKGREIGVNSHAALNFFWPELERQIRIEGQIRKLSREASEAYFKSRPRGNQIGAWVSPQSERIPGREFIEMREKEFIARFEGEEVPCPAYWGGYELVAQYVEFWQGRESRLHDRIVYEKGDDQLWKRMRLAP